MKKAIPRTQSKSLASQPLSNCDSLLSELSILIEQSKNSVVSYVNNTLTMLFWQIGNRINGHILNHKRAAYGEQIVATLSRQLSWSHFITIIPLRNAEARLFYAQAAATENLGIRELRKNIDNKIFERKSLIAIHLPMN